MDTRVGQLTSPQADDLLADSLRLRQRITPCSELAAVALPLALRTERTVCDCLYLALAVRLKAVMVSSDGRPVNAPPRGLLSRLGVAMRRHSG